MRGDTHRPPKVEGEREAVRLIAAPRGRISVTPERARARERERERESGVLCLSISLFREQHRNGPESRANIPSDVARRQICRRAGWCAGRPGNSGLMYAVRVETP